MSELCTDVNSSANKLQGGLEVTLVADLKAKDQYIVCHAMCDEIGKHLSACNEQTLTEIQLELQDRLRSGPRYPRVFFLQ